MLICITDNYRWVSLQIYPIKIDDEPSTYYSVTSTQHDLTVLFLVPFHPISSLLSLIAYPYIAKALMAYHLHNYV